MRNNMYSQENAIVITEAGQPSSIWEYHVNIPPSLRKLQGADF